MTHSGRCLCGDIIYEVQQPPFLLTVCHCHSCQRSTGSDYLTEPLFSLSAFRLQQGQPKVFSKASASSGKAVHYHFCARCGTTLYLTFDRWSEIIGLYGGTLDDPDWYKTDELAAQYIFLDDASEGTLIPAGVPTYAQHAFDLSEKQLAATLFDDIHQISRR